MKNRLITILLLLGLVCGPAMAAPGAEREVPRPVVVQVERDTGGRVLKAWVSGREYRLKVLLPGGRVQVISVPRKNK